jgi:hypothetical protein
MKKTLTEPLWGDQIKLGIDPVQIPPVSFLDVSGDYYDRADFRVEYKPDDNLPLGERADVEVIRRSSGSAVVSSLGASEVRSMFQPIMADGDVCPAQNNITHATNPIPTDRKLATWRLMSAVAASTSNTPFQLSEFNSPSVRVWDLVGSGRLPNYLQQTIIKLPVAATNVNPISIAPSDISLFTATTTVQDLIAVQGNSNFWRVIEVLPTTNQLRLHQNLIASQNAAVTLVGRRVVRSNVDDTTKVITINTSRLGWEVGDQLRTIAYGGSNMSTSNSPLSGGTSTITITAITANSITYSGSVAMPNASSTNPTTFVDVRLNNKSLQSITDGATVANAPNLRDCLRPAALQQNNAFRNNREARDMNLLQLSMEGLTLWNRDGMIPQPPSTASSPQYFATVLNNAGADATSLTFTSADDVSNAGFTNDLSLKIIPNDSTSRPETYQIIGVSGATVSLNKPLAGAVPAGSLAMIVASNKLFEKAPADTSLTTDLTKPEARSYAALGLAASDRTEGGLVFHLTVNGSAYNGAGGNTSPYGFALTRGANLPGPLTIASDQAIYVQGDYNCNVLPLDPATNGLERRSCRPNDTLTTGWEPNPDQAETVDKIWQPAAVMADSLNVLSNNCVNNNNLLDCGVAGNQPGALSATIYSAFLSGVDTTNGSSYNGGLENYPRFHENWGGSAGQRLFYRGSFVGLDLPEHVSGRWSNQVYTPPARRWAYESKFDDPTRLPPLAPRFVYLKQELFVRDFKR